MAKDPVCKEEVIEASALSSIYQGETFYFSSAECKADFDREPSKYSHDTIQAKAEHASVGAQTRIRSMIGKQKDQITDRMGSVSSALKTASQRLKEQDQEAVARYADSAAARIEDLAGYIGERDAGQIIHEAQDFVRRRPALAFGSALAAGFLAARFLKSSRTVAM